VTPREDLWVDLVGVSGATVADGRGRIGILSDRDLLDR
jgi:hypothetical protein